MAVPNLDGTDNVVRILRADSTIQSIDWEKDRAGGVSSSPYESFNLGDHVGDDPTDVASNRTRLHGL